MNDGFAFRLPCGSPLEGDEPLGAIYTNRTRARDGKIDPALPDGLIYEPTPDGLRLVGVELIMPSDLWSNPDLPSFFGHTFHVENAGNTLALHVWLWLNNPDGMFAESNPRVTC